MYIPKSGKGFIECNKNFTDKDYTQEVLAFIRREQRRSNVMTSARSQPFCRKNNINVGCYDGFRVCPRNNAERNRALYVYKKQFCFNWETPNIGFKKAIEDKLEPNFKVVDNIVSHKHVKSFVQYE